MNIDGESDGYVVIRALREINPRCVVIVLTAFPSVETAVEGIREGIDDYITKPSNADALVALLAEKLAARARENDPDRQQLSQPRSNSVN